MEVIQNKFGVLKDQIGNNSHDLSAYSQLSEQVIDVMNGNDSRDVMFNIAATIVNASSFDTIMEIMNIANDSFIQKINEDNEGFTTDD